MNQTANEVYALCLCDHYDFAALKDYLSRSYSIEHIRNVMQLQWHGGKIFIFDYGVSVFWKLPCSTNDCILPVSDSISIQLFQFFNARAL